MGCYEKNPYWASCKMTCKPGIDPADPPEYQDPWSCKHLGGASPPTPAPPLPPVDPPKNADPYLTYMSGNLGRAKTTRYWDCCKPSCAWGDKAHVTKPVKVCDKDGSSPLGPNSKNVCGGGGSGGPCYMCTGQQPWYNSDRKMSFGFAAAHVTGMKEKDSCCACFELRFESSKVPRMVLQVGNTGSDLGDNQFDIQVPGGGFGIFDGCTKQWELPSKTSWGKRYGGIMAAGLGKKGCKDRMPKEYQEGCEWQFDHLGDNPKVKEVYKVACPAEIVAITGCKREDDATETNPGPAPGPPRRRSDDRRRTPPTDRRRTPPRRRSPTDRRRTAKRRRGPPRRRSKRRRGTKRRRGSARRRSKRRRR